MTQHYMKFDEDRRGESRFWHHTFLRTEFAKDDIIHGLLIKTRGRVLLKRKGLMQEPSTQCPVVDKSKTDGSRKSQTNPSD